jgi:hypothetical protein
MDFVAFVEKKVGEIAAVLSCDAGDECFFHLIGIILKELLESTMLVDGQTDSPTQKLKPPLPFTQCRARSACRKTAAAP